MNKLSFLLFFLFCVNIGLTQNFDWQTITNMNDIRDLTIYNNKIWAVSEGGAFIYDPSNESIEKITNINGLKSIDLQAVAADTRGNIILGSTVGDLQSYNPENDLWMDIQFDGTDIKKILVAGDTLWVAAGSGSATGAGVAVFLWRDNQWEYSDFFVNFPGLIQTVTSLAVYNNRVWLATNIGLISAPSDFSSNTLTDPENWDLQTTTDGLPSNSILSLTVFNSKLWIGTAKGLAYISDGLIQYNGTYGPNPIVGLGSNGQYLIVLRTKTYFEYDLNQGIVKRIDFPDEINTVVGNKDGQAWIAIKTKGLRNNFNNKSVLIDGPSQNHTRFLIKDSSGRIWASTNKFGLTPPEGYSVFENGLWQSVLFNGTYWYFKNSPTYIYEDRFENIWIGTWGGGIEVLHAGDYLYFHNYDNPGTKIITTVDTTITQQLSPNDSKYRNFFVGVEPAPYYEVVTFFKEDFYGRLWIINSEAINGEYLAVAPYVNGFLDLNKNNWTYFGKDDGIKVDAGIETLEFDDYGRVWIGTQKNGLYIFDYNNTLNTKADDHISHLLVTDNLYSNTIKTIAKDKDGIIWIGSDAGLNSYDGANVYKYVGDDLGLNGPVNNTINQIVVDDYNNKWIATAGGISILRAGKSPFEPGAWISYDTKNSGLVNDNVQSIYVDNKTSEAVIGTENGISLFHGSFAEIQDNFDHVVAGPNPFILENDNIFTIKKLKENTTVKIFDLSGTLIRQLTAKDKLVDGSRAIWNGKDSNGNKVASGIYLYLAYTENGNSFSGKVAVIRK